MRPLRYSINVTLDGCCDHGAIIPDEALHRHAAETIARADALLFGRVTYELMRAAWKLPMPAEMPAWTEPFARTIDAAKKYLVSSSLEQVDWNTELLRGDLGEAVQKLKREPGNGFFTGGEGSVARAGLIMSTDHRAPGSRATRHCSRGYRRSSTRSSWAGARLGGSGDAVRAQEIGEGGVRRSRSRPRGFEPRSRAEENAMKPRISVLTIAVADIERALTFYRDGLGLPTEGIVGREFEHGSVAFFELAGGLKLAIWAQDDIAHDTGLPKAPISSTSFTIGHNVVRREQVDQVMEQAARAGADIVKAAQETFYGGDAGYCRDLTVSLGGRGKRSPADDLG